MTIVSPVPNTLQNGTTADATQVMANFNSIVADVNANAAHSGANADITSLLALSTPISYLLGGTNVFLGGTVTGTANAIVLAAPVPTGGFDLTAGKRVVFVATANNTGATTLNVGGTGVKNVFKLTPTGPVALTGGEIISGNAVQAIYDGTQYQLVTTALTTFGPLTSLASAGTTDLGTVPSQNVNITGVTTITAFGSTASLSYPIYLLNFAGILTLTHNGTSLIIPGAANITTAAGDTAIVEYLGSGNWRVRQYTKASGLPIVTPATMKGLQVFTTGSGTYTPTAGTTSALAIITGGGGGGGGVSTANHSAAGGGGGGATAFAFIASPAAVSYGVGAAGAAGVNTGGTGGTGGQTTLGTISANGGAGGVGDTTGGGQQVGGAGASTTANATFSIPGSNGAASAYNNHAVSDLAIPGYGGGSFWGMGATPPNPFSGGAPGNAGAAPGSGGSGATDQSSTAAIGGAGAAGIVVVLEF